MEIYQVPVLGNSPRIEVTVPGSKSITNRALLMAAMAEGETVLSGVLFSEDSLVFLEALRELGFDVRVEEEERRVTVQGLGGVIPKEEASVYVGSAGTAARFLTAFVAMAKGTYRLEASEQMRKRPMKELLDALRQMGAVVRCLEEEDTFPLEIIGIGERQGEAEISLNIDRSSQFLSAVLMTAPICFERLLVRLTGSRSARSYVEMTEQMMRQFGHPGVRRLSEQCYEVAESGYMPQNYVIEPDVSAACYFYAMAAVTGGSACVKYMRRDSLQGDMKFLQVLEQMGCHLQWREGQLYLQGPPVGTLHGISVDMSDFSDQVLTLAAVAPYADSPVEICNVAHIRGQECDRLHAVAVNLGAMGVVCHEREDGFTVEPSQPQPAVIRTFQDHRVAMAFAVCGVRTEGIQIENPQCCRKTFQNYFEILDQITNKDKK